MNSVLVWWTDQANCEAVMKYHANNRDQVNIMGSRGRIPDYVWSELESRSGRSGRGRLWVSSEHPELSVNLHDKFDMANDFHRYLSDQCAGIPFLYNDLYPMQMGFGFITDLDLRLILDRRF